MEKVIKKKEEIVKIPNNKTVKSNYDKKADVLYVSFGKPESSETLDMGEDLLIRFNPVSGAITGFTILNFSLARKDMEEQILSRN
ncbi:MAG: DUF2283 domain-containing protein [Ignavibacteria bacterium]|nr:DUF2283 domain-containing protein [Ignavibacteria bacterium]